MRVGKSLADLPAVNRPAQIASSPLKRCRETAAPLASNLDLAVEIALEVGEIPTPRRLAASERPAWLRAALSGAWSEIRGDLDYEVWRRAVADAVSQRPQTAIFSHFVAINAVVSLLEGSDRVTVFRPDHASVTVLEVEGGKLSLVARGDQAVTGVL